MSHHTNPDFWKSTYTMAMFVNLWVKLFFVLTPFFALTMFLSLTEQHEEAQRRKLALSVSIVLSY